LPFLLSHLLNSRTVRKRRRRKFEQSIVDLNDATTFKLSGRGGAFLLRKRRRKKKKKRDKRDECELLQLGSSSRV